MFIYKYSSHFSTILRKNYSIDKSFRESFIAGFWSHFWQQLRFCSFFFFSRKFVVKIVNHEMKHATIIQNSSFFLGGWFSISTINRIFFKQTVEIWGLLSGNSIVFERVWNKKVETRTIESIFSFLIQLCWQKVKYARISCELTVTTSIWKSLIIFCEILNESRFFYLFMNIIMSI